MKPTCLPLVLGIMLSLPLALAAETPNTAVLPVTSPAFIFSPGNWSGDTGRTGDAYRQTLYPGAYFRVTWTTNNTHPTAELLLDTSTFGEKFKSLPELTYCIDGIWTSGIKAEPTIPIKNLSGAGLHSLVVYFKTSEQIERWGTPLASGLNVVRVTGLRLNRDCTSVPAAPLKRWVLIIGDSITEGNAADFGKSDSVAGWSYFVGIGLQSLGFEYGVMPCGYSGWLRPGDRNGDVPPYYLVSHSQNGLGGSYDDTRSRWNKIDARTSLLDSKKHLSAYGATGQEPSAIIINFGTNDGLSNANSSDLRASIAQALQALQSAAPEASIFIVIPFGQYAAADLKAGVETCHAANPSVRPVTIIDLGDSVAKGLAANGYWSGLHPNMRGHATFSAQILAQVVRRLPSDQNTP